MKRILTVGGATQDWFIKPHSPDHMTIRQTATEKNYFLFEAGKKLSIDNLATYIGGGATNSAAALTKLNYATSTLCSIGNDEAGTFIRNQLDRLKINSSLVQSASNLPTATSYIISAENIDETIFVHRGANKDLELTLAAQAFDCVYITSLCDKAAQQLDAFTEHARSSNALVAINPGSNQLSKSVGTLKKALAFTDIFIVNTAEAQLFMMALIESDEAYLKALESNKHTSYCPSDVSLDSPCLLTYPLPSQSLLFSIKNYFKEVLAMGPRIVGITNGANGVYLADEKQMYFHPSLPIKVRDTVGAGDAFGATFTSCILAGQEVEDALRSGIVNSACVIEQSGAQAGQLTSNQLEQRVKKLDRTRAQTFTW